MNAPVPPFPSNPRFNQRFGNWVWNGSRWACTQSIGTAVITQVFPASAPYTPSPGLVSCVVETWGGGGGGGSAGPVPTTEFILGGGGGGSGGYSRITLAAALVLGGVNVTVGAGGAGGGQGATPGVPMYGTGANGAATSFGALCVANGGRGGSGNNGNTTPPAPDNQNGAGGAGGAPGVGDIAWPGAPGFMGVYAEVSGLAHATYAGGRGGWLMAGGPDASGEWNGQYANGSSAMDGTGSGGSGSIISQIGGGPLAGGWGGSGLCVVTEYCWSDAGDDSDCGCGPTGAARVARYSGGHWDDHED